MWPRLEAALRDRRFMAICLAVAATIRVSFALILEPIPTSDAGFYWEAANGIAAGRGYTYDGVLTAYWPVGYPAILSVPLVLGPHLWLALLVQALASIGVVWAIWRLAARWTGSETVARLAAALVAVLPIQWVYCSILLSEPIYTLLLLVCAWLLWSADDEPSWGRVVIGGVVAGLSCLIKPQTALLPALIMLADLPRLDALPRRLPRIIAAHVVMLMVVTPWTLRNLEVFGRFVPVSNNGGVNLYIGNSPQANGRYVEGAALVVAGDDEVARDRRSRDAALTWMRSNPAGAAALVPAKVFWFYAPDYSAVRLVQAGLQPLSPLASAATWGLLALTAATDGLSMLLVPGLFLWWLGAGRPPVVRAGPALVLALHALHLVFFSTGRFHFSIVPLSMIGLAAVIVRWGSAQDLNNAPT